jgi:hypothetical protein
VLISIFNDTAHTKMHQAVVASQILYLVTTGLTSLSLTLLMRRIFTTNTKHKIGSYLLLGVVSSWLVLAIAGVKIHCPATHILEGQEHTCPNDVSFAASVGNPLLNMHRYIDGEPYSQLQSASRLLSWACLSISSAIFESN